jgi:DNA-binding transcriptional LysR family regulator
MNPASSLARKATTAAVSAGSPTRPSANEAPSSARRSLVRWASRPVAELPGATALTVIRRGANSSAATLVTWSRNALVPAYSALPGSAVLVTAEDTFTTLPPSASRVAAACITRNGPRAFTATSRSKSASDVSASGPQYVIPALLTRMSTRPNSRTAASAEELNFTRAAERLGIAQPPLSTAIGKLERKLGVTLLDRTSRRVTLTPAGATLLDQGRVAVEQVGAAVERTRRRGTLPDRLTVAVKAGGGTELIRSITQRCAREPGMPPVHLLFGHPGGPAAALRAGRADVAILRSPFMGRGLDWDVLLTEPRVAVLPPDHRLAGRRRLCRADLAGETMPRWAGETNPASAAYWTGTDAPSGAGPGVAAAGAGPRPAGPEISDMNQLLDVVALGQAVAFVPKSVTDRYGAADLVFVPVTDLTSTEVVTAWPEGSRSPAVAAFVRVAADAAADLPTQAAALA